MELAKKLSIQFLEKVFTGFRTSIGSKIDVGSSNEALGNGVGKAAD